MFPVLLVFLLNMGPFSLNNRGICEPLLNLLVKPAGRRGREETRTVLCELDPDCNGRALGCNPSPHFRWPSLNPSPGPHRPVDFLSPGLYCGQQVELNFSVTFQKRSCSSPPKGLSRGDKSQMGRVFKLQIEWEGIIFCQDVA